MQGYGRFDQHHIFNVDGVKKAYFFDNDISGVGGMTKRGSDILVMNGNNTYTGNTLIEEGELVANGNSASAHSVSQGAKLTVGDSGAITLGSVTNKGELNVQSSDLNINGDLDNQDGAINQAIGTKISVSGSANLKDSSLTITGVRNGYVTKAGTKEVLLSATNGISNKDSFKFNFANVGELIKNTYNLTDNELSVTTSRESIGDVVRDKTDFTGRDKTVTELDGLLDRMDIANLPTGWHDDYSSSNSSTAQTQTVAGSGVANALLDSTNINETVFSLSSSTVQHAQEQLAHEKLSRADKTIYQGLMATPQGSVWADVGVGETKARHLSDVQAKSTDNSQTIGAAKRFGANGEHSVSAQISNLSHRWSETFGSVEKNFDTKGVGLEASYVHLFKNRYWLAATLGADILKVKSNQGTKDTGHQYLFGVSAGKGFKLLDDKLMLMPYVGLQHIRQSGADYRLGYFGGDDVVVRNGKIQETGLTAGVSSWVNLGFEGRLRLQSDLKLFKVLNGKATMTNDYGGYTVYSSTKLNGRRPDVDISAGLNLQATQNLNLGLKLGYVNGKLNTKRYGNIGLTYQF